MISYAQNFEDVMLWRALKNIQNGFYIDVGANDPEQDSVTKHFYDSGWHGINIEPVRSLYQALIEKRPRDINLDCAAGERREKNKIWQCSIGGWATVDESTADQHEAEGFQGAYSEVEVVPLNEICAKYAKGPIHFLKIDVEGFEREVLKGLDLSLYRPWIILVEATRPNTTIEVFQNWENLILSNGYLFAYADGLNRFYLSQEKSDLLSIFKYPPNVFDNFERRASEIERNKIQHMQAEYSKIFSERSDMEKIIDDLKEEINLINNEMQALIDKRSKSDQEFRELEVEYKKVKNDLAEVATGLKEIQGSKAWKILCLARVCFNKIFPKFSLRRRAARRFFKSAWCLVRWLRFCSKALVKFLKRKNNGKIGSDGSFGDYGNEQFRKPSLYFDVSRISALDLGTGIHRATKEIAKRFISNPLNGYETKLVRISGGKYITDNSMTKLFYGASTKLLETEVDCIKGDIFLGIDLVPEVVDLTGWFEKQKRNGLKIFFMVHDLIPILHPEYFPPHDNKWFQQWINAVVRVSTGLICNSKATESVVKKWIEENQKNFNEKPEVRWAYLGSDFATRGSRKALKGKEIFPFKKNISAINFLIVGTVEPRKGHLDILACFERLWNADYDVQLVIVGKKGWVGSGAKDGVDISTTLMDHSENGKRLFWLNNVTDHDLDLIYRNVHALVVPSYIEGFGLPLIEGSGRGAHVIARDIPVFREVGGDHVSYFQSGSTSTLVKFFENWISDFHNGRLPKPGEVVGLTWDESFENIKKILSKKIRIAYIGHSYHLKTRSSSFLIDDLSKYYELELILDDSWQGAPYPDLSHIDDEYQLVIFFQSVPPKKNLGELKNNNLVFFPMFDGYGGQPSEWWKALAQFKFFNFSHTLNSKLQGLNLDTRYLQYFPPVDKIQLGRANEVFFWQRVSAIDIKLVLKLVGDRKVKIHLHEALDPGNDFVEPSTDEIRRYQITTSKWFENKLDLMNVVVGKQIYIAPRVYEGIGMSFLEAMAMGKVVVAVDHPTMNEYIAHGKTGFLFSLNEPKRLKLRRLLSVQKRTFLFMKNGRKVWENKKSLIMNFLFSYRPKISIVTVCYNEEMEIQATCRSIVSQTYNCVEWIVVDGGSTDGTLDILGDFKPNIQRIVSEKDNGIYDAMNKGIALATGDYIIFMNAGDCFVNENVIADCFINRSRYADIIYGNCISVQKDGEKIPWLMANPVTMEYLCSFTGINHQSAFIRRNLFSQFGLYDLTYKIVADSEKWCCFLENKVSYLKYEGDIALYKSYDGLSSSEDNKAVIDRERKRIVDRYINQKL